MKDKVSELDYIIIHLNLILF